MMNKLKETIAYILGKYPHKLEMSNARLTKIVYLSDWKHAIEHKQQITNIKWYFDNYGPYVSDVKEEIEKHSDIFAKQETKNMFGSPKTVFSLKNKTNNFDLNQEEKDAINHIIKVTKSLNWDDFIKLVYSTHPILSSNRYSDLDLVAKAKEYTASEN